MHINKRNIFISIILLAGLQTVSIAQFSFGSGLNLSYNDNINGNFEFLSDEITELYFSGSYIIPSRNHSFELYYNGAFDYFRRNVSRTFHEHTAGLLYTNNFSKRSTSELNIGSSLSMSFNRDDYSYLNYGNLNAFANFMTYTGERTLWESGYDLGFYRYNELSLLNNLQNYVYTSLTGFLPTKTSLSIKTGIGVKSYITSMGMRGKGMQNNLSINSLGESLLKFDIEGSVAQTIFDKTGLSISGGYIKNLKSDSRYLVSGNAVINDIFNDDYSYEGPYVEASLTQMLPWQISTVISGSYEYRKYTDRPAYNIREEIISDERTDKLVNASVSIIKRFDYLDIKLNYNYLLNSTNDEFYSNKNNIFSLELGTGF